jgi:hypothetical protein
MTDAITLARKEAVAELLVRKKDFSQAGGNSGRRASAARAGLGWAGLGWADG